MSTEFLRHHYKFQLLFTFENVSEDHCVPSSYFELIFSKSPLRHASDGDHVNLRLALKKSKDESLHM